tara:strand:- start:495 stop:797 length:303 start_codon:yes stop_codon:yes gene_type:complete
MRNRLAYIAEKRKGKKIYYKNLKYPDIPLSSDDIYILTTVGDRLDSLAYRFYNDVRLWWIIANANPTLIKRDGYGLEPNLEIRVPQNITLILKDFEQINK